MTKQYQTQDINLAAALNCMGYKIEAIDPTEQTKCIFYIEYDSEIDEIVQMFWSGNLKLSVITFANSLRYLKHRVKKILKF